MALTRKPFWDTRHFHDYLISSATEPFAWSQNDCCLWAANGIEAMTGVDIASDFRGQYKDLKSSIKLTKKLTGGTSVADAVAYCATQHGLVEYTHPLFAQRGDLVVFEDGGNQIAGLVHLNGRHVTSISEGGVMRLPITKVLRAWSV